MGKTGILLVNLGSPASPAVTDVKNYLNEFLMDGRVMDMPSPLRRLVVSGFILPFRPQKSAHAYASIWWEDGSPLLVISKQLAEKLQKKLPGTQIELAMRYGQPSIEGGIKALQACNVEKIFLVPLYPHYAMSTFETVHEAVRSELKKSGTRIKLQVIQPFYEKSEYIQALVESTRPTLADGYDHLLFSYHGIPIRHLRKTDPTGNHCQNDDDCCMVSSPAHDTCYRHQVYATTSAFVRLAGIPEGKYSVAFQSRLGSDAWLQPAADVEIHRLAKEGVRKLAVICPSFVSDCLETLEEMGIRGRASFLQAGGESFTLIPCLNDQPLWVQALAGWCQKVL